EQVPPVLLPVHVRQLLLEAHAALERPERSQPFWVNTGARIGRLRQKRHRRRAGASHVRVEHPVPRRLNDLERDQLPAAALAYLDDRGEQLRHLSVGVGAQELAGGELQAQRLGGAEHRRLAVVRLGGAAAALLGAVQLAEREVGAVSGRRAGEWVAGLALALGGALPGLEESDG